MRRPSLSGALARVRLPSHSAWKRWGRASRLRQSLDGLPQALAPLARFGALSDQEFAGLAQGLQGFRTSNQRLQEQALRLGALLRSGDDTGLITDALRLGKQAIELVHSSIGVAYSLQRQVDEVEQVLEETTRFRQDFEANQTVFRTLSIGFRIEAARCEGEHQAVFLTVANEFRQLGQKMVETTNEGFEAIVRLSADMAQEHRQTRNNQETIYQECARRVTTLRTELTQMEKALRPCGEKAAEAAEYFSATDAAISGVVGHLQYQDIVRQKLEHVAHGVEDVQRVMKERGRGAGAALRVQQAQLTRAEEQISSAGERLLEGIGQIVSLGRQARERVAELESIALQDHGTRRLADSLAHELSQLAKVAEVTQRTHRHIAKTVEEIEQVIGYFTREISAQQNLVRLLALNAQVAAARLEDGGVLEKLAQETNRVARTNKEVTQRLSDRLGQALQTLQSIRSEAGDSLDVLASEKDRLEKDSVGVSETLSRRAEEIENDSRAIAQESSEIEGALDRLVRSVTFPQRISKVFSGLRRHLEEILEALDAEGERADETLLEHHAARYTMEEERKTHRVAAASGMAGLAAGAAVVADFEGADMPVPDAPSTTGDASVELFNEKPEAGEAFDEEDGIELF